MSWRTITSRFAAPVFSAVLLCATLQPSPGMAQSAPAETGNADGLFGSREFKSTRMSAFTKWTGMLERFDREHAEADPECQPTRFTRCYYKSWQSVIADNQGLDMRSQIEAVHRHMNRSPYITDPRNWGKKDYWETPGEFFRKDGDCEDYAIIKYLTLKALGVDPTIMRIVVVQDLNLDIPHAVLVIEFEGQTLILDNQIAQVVDSRSVHHYRPIYSINENAWWLYRL